MRAPSNSIGSMSKQGWVFGLTLLSLLTGSLTAEIRLHSGSGAGVVSLVGSDDRSQIVATDKSGRDVTREVSFSVEPAEVATIDATGFLVPKKDGKATLIAKTSGENPQVAKMPVTVERFANPRPVSFANDVVPVFTRQHCNAGACHAKDGGQNGFRLSLLGYEAMSDYEQIVKHSRGRRVSPGAPENSYFLMKATGDIPHEGGARLDKDSLEYRKIVRWIESGLEFRPENDPDVERVEVFPKTLVTKPGAKQQLAVTAYYSDGTSRDVTRAVQYEAHDTVMADSNETGLVTVGEKTGNTAVLVRFQEHIDIIMIRIPLGADVPSTPAPKNFIDEHIFSQLKTMGLPPSPLADDSVFLRRVTLDIAGRIPTAEETETFLTSKDPDKRAKKIDELLASPDYADHFAGKWASILRNKVDRGRDWVARDSHAFHAWIRTSLIENKPYDQFASELVLASGKAIENPAVSWYRVVEDQKERMENVAQIFLGIRMQCAQCHHHPYEQWSQEDYFSFTAFFSTISKKNVRKLPEEDIIYHNRKVAQAKHPNTNELLKPRLLGETASLEIPGTRDPRFELAKWMRSGENPYFPRVLVNRYWKHFFSRGLVEPEDDIRPTNPATHPELLEELAASFADSGFDLKQLIRTICNSRTYQLSSEPNGVNQADEQNFARYYPKRMTAELLLDSINDVTWAKNSFTRQPAGVRAVALPNEKGTTESEFLTMFGRPAMDTACECERKGEANLGQSLHLLNSDKIQAKLTAGNGRAANLAKDKERSDEERITELYIHGLSRKPAPEELAIGLAHLKKKREQSKADPKALPAEQAEKEAFEDIVWVLLNTKEFMFVR